jgi:copper chaperone CopZ
MHCIYCVDDLHNELQDVPQALQTVTVTSV